MESSLIPLSYAQQRLWFLNRLDGPNSTYNVPVAFRLTGPLNESAFAAAFGDLLERHEILRTVCREHDGLVHQHVEQVPAERLPLRVVACRDGELAQTVHEASRHPFDLESELPVTAWLFRSGPEERVLLLVLHHLVCDGWSLRPLLDDLSTAYRARSEDAARQWDPLPVQYGDYTLWQRELLGHESDPSSLMARQLSYWEEELAGLPDEVDFPADRVRPPVAGNQGGRVPFEVPAQVCAGLARTAREEGATLFMVLQAAVAGLLSRLGCGTDIAVGTSVAGRVDEALDGLVGFFVNTLVLRTDVAGDPDFRTLVQRVRRTCIDAYAHQDVPFDRVVERLNPVRSLARNPLYQVAVEVHAGGDEGLSLASVRCAGYELVQETVKSDLAFTFTETVDATGRPLLAGELGYAKDLFDRETVEEVVLGLERLLAEVAAHPDRRVGAVALLSGQEREMLIECDARPIQPGAEVGLVERVREWATRQPDAVAVVDDHGSTSYGLLAGRASRIARRLTDTGVRRGQVVAVLAERNANVIEAFLGIGTAGAVYLPLDPEAPPARSAGLLADAGAVCVVTDQAHSALVDEVLDLAGGGIDALVIDGRADEPAAAV
ncbi:condensation domain-containing protein [Streptomyces sp. NBC_00057]|uniref:condensation domain-containing protein n=1 Tax=Streptomyces sp. NBC_00057 TaxID=2975634 RepID=UPI003244B28E